MLRRRILASAMASVMALGSVAVVANAEETAAATKQVKTKADLEAYVKSFDKFRTDGVNDYGSHTGDQFLGLCDFAENVLADESSTVDDYTVAYKLLESFYANMKIHTVEELKALVKENTKIYESNNLLNEEFGDAIYKDDNGQWGNFTNAYEEAESVLDSADSRIINDAYDNLTYYKSKLSALTAVTKSQFRTVLKNLETAMQKEFKYDSWRRGTVDGDLSWAFEGSTQTWGVLYAAAQKQIDLITEQYKKLDERKSVNKTTDPTITAQYDNANTLATVLGGFKVDDVTRGSKAAVTKLLGQYHGQLVHDYATTAANNLFTAIHDNDANVEYKQKSGDGSKYAKVTTANPNPFFLSTADMGVATAVSSFSPDYIGVTKLIGAEISVKPSKDLWLAVDGNGYAVLDAHSKPTVYTSDPGSSVKTVRLNKNVKVDITKYIDVKAAAVTDDVNNSDMNNVYDGDSYNVTIHFNWGGSDTFAGSMSGSWAFYNMKDASGVQSALGNASYVNSSNKVVKSYVTLDTAMTLAENYLNGNYGLADIDTTDSITSGSEKGSSAEWALVYRYLKYALEDKYEASTGTKTKADVVKLIEDSYDLADKTGDAAMFATKHAALVNKRQDANEWVKAANKDKTYKDANSVVLGKTATMVWNDLMWGAYSSLNDMYNAFSLSYGDLYNAIADTADKIDNEELKPTEALLDAMNKLALGLADLESIEGSMSCSNWKSHSLDNDVFTTDFYFNKNNRLYTKDGEYVLDVDGCNGRHVILDSTSADNSASYAHNQLKKAYEALQAEIKKQTNPDAVLGDVNGDGVVNALDASAILKAVVAGTEIDVKVGDYNADGTVNALDASAILKFVVSQG